MINPGWTLQQAQQLCVQIEAVCPEFGCHVALTGGTLYKTGWHKDLDLVMYRIRQVPSINVLGLFARLALLDIVVDDIERMKKEPFVVKASYRGGMQRMDFLFPESTYGVYVAG